MSFVRTRGFSLIELAFVIAVIGIVTTLTVPLFTSQVSRVALRQGVSEISRALALAQWRATMLGHNAGVKFHMQQGEWVFSVYDDADGDGVRNDDIADGIDPLFLGPSRIARETSIVEIGIGSAGTIHPDDGRVLGVGSTPIHFNRSAICSFSADGSGTAGSVYLRDHAGSTALVRVSGDGGRIHALLYDPRQRRWRPL